MTDEASAMRLFGEQVVVQGLDYWKIANSPLVFSSTTKKRLVRIESSLIISKKKLAVLLIATGCELIFKSKLVRNGYCIYELNQSKGKVLKKDELVNKDLTIGMALTIATLEKITEHTFNGIRWATEVRNKVAHHGVDVPDKSNEDITKIIEDLIWFYEYENSASAFLAYLMTERDQIQG